MKDKYLTSRLTFNRFLTLTYERRKKAGSDEVQHLSGVHKTKTDKNKNKKIRIMKKTIIAAVAALFLTIGANAQSVNDNNATVNDIVAELSQADALQFIPMYQKMLSDIENVCRAENLNEEGKTARIEDLKDEYTEKFSAVLVTAQNEVAINSIPMEYINARIAK